MFPRPLCFLFFWYLGLPDMDGMEFIEFVRRDSLAPIIVLSARTNEADKIAALDAGANDYITKPFSSGELLARVRVALRNNRFSAEEGSIKKTAGQYGQYPKEAGRQAGRSQLYRKRTERRLSVK